VTSFSNNCECLSLTFLFGQLLNCYSKVKVKERKRRSMEGEAFFLSFLQYKNELILQTQKKDDCKYELDEQKQKERKGNEQ